MTALTLNDIPIPGVQLDAALVAASGGGDTALTGPGVFLVVKNGDASPHTVTLITPGSVRGVFAIADEPVTVAAGKTEFIALVDVYRDPSTGRASITYDAVTSLQVGVFRASAS